MTEQQEHLANLVKQAQDLSLELEGLQNLLLRPSSEIIAEADLISKLPPVPDPGKVGG